ncbi:Cochaperone prefoldin complex subunit [Sporothrix epigloea]|uniref:Cochaperone prefoldin complex subunit n=1 Tax=Sporothrix epigloea TaxID=1892477 RepID=A0ABP0DL35_9PEZI
MSSAATSSPVSSQPASAKRQQGGWSTYQSRSQIAERGRGKKSSPRILFSVDLQVQYSNFKNALQQIAQKIGDVEQEADEHKYVMVVGDRSKKMGLVLETLEPLAGNRKCFRMINGVLIERTVADVVPALKTNAEGLKKVLEDLVKQYKAREDDLTKWKKKNNVQVVQS